MTTLIGTLFKKDGKNIDQTIVDSILVGGKSIAGAYLEAILNTCTPELRAIYLSHLEEILTGHSNLLQMSVQCGWSKHYDSPENQLLEAYNKATAIAGQAEMRNS
jgi:spore coat protein CotF